MDTFLQRAMLDGDTDDTLQRLRRNIRFGDVILRALLHGGDGYLLVALAGQHHHGDERVFGAYTLQDFEAVVPRQRIIEQYTDRFLLPDEPESRITVIGLGKAVTCIHTFLQGTAVEQPVIFAVIDNEYVHGFIHKHLHQAALLERFATRFPLGGNHCVSMLCSLVLRKGLVT